MEEESVKLSEQPLQHELEKELQKSTKKHFNWAEFLACVSVATTNLHTGFALGYSAIITSQLTNDNNVNSTENHVNEMGLLNESQLSWISSSISIAAPLGCLFIAFSLDKIGRISTFKISLWPCFIGWMLIAFAYNPYIIIIGRLFTGFAMAVGTNSANVYMAEISSPKLRGTMMSIGSVMLSFGVLLMYASGLYLHWRNVAWIAFIGAILPVFMTALWTPESPLWLIQRGQDDKAIKSLKYFQNSKLNSDVQESFNEMKKNKETKDSLTSNDINNSNVFKRFTWHLSKPTVYKPVVLLSMLFVLQQLTGIYALQFNAVKMLQEVADEVDYKLATLLFGFFRLILSFVATAMLHNYGRRPLCIITGIIMGIALFIAGLCLHLKTIGVQSIFMTWMPLLCMLLYISAGSVGLMLIPWILPSEMLPTEVKGLFLGPIMAWSNAVMFLATHFYMDLKNMFGGMLGILWFYSLISIFTVFFVWLFIPETHIMKLSEIENYFKNNTLYILRDKKTVKRQQLSL